MTEILYQAGPRAEHAYLAGCASADPDSPAADGRTEAVGAASPAQPARRLLGE